MLSYFFAITVGHPLPKYHTQIALSNKQQMLNNNSTPMQMRPTISGPSTYDSQQSNLPPSGRKRATLASVSPSSIRTG